MKTTLELPDALFVAAKAAAVRRRITLKTLFTRALERELRPDSPPLAAAYFEIDAHGWPILKRPPGRPVGVTEDFINALRQSEGI
jgi:hypothetical protein